jgi:curli biogenesis system outer membrane secretion channel CsgG
VKILQTITHNILIRQGLLVLILGALIPQPAMADYLAYASTKDGKKIPLPQNIDGIDAKFLLNLEWGKYRGKRIRTAVLPVENTSSQRTVHVSSGGGYSSSYSVSSGGIPVQGIEAIITDVMNRTGRFRLVERTVLNQQIKEQDLGATGRISRPSAAKVGKILGAKYQIQAVVTNYDPGVEGQNIGIGGLLGGRAGALLGGVGIKSSKSLVGMNFRLIDSETSEILYTKQVESVISESGLTFGGAGFGRSGGLGGFLSNYSKTPIGQAVIAAINKGIFDLVQQIGANAASGSVVTVKGSKIYLNMGKGAVKVGERLNVFSKGEALIDPETGLSLGGEEEKIGQVEVTSVKKKYSIARVVSGNRSRFKKGSKVVSTSTPSSLQYASSWQPPEEGFFSKSNTGSGSSSGTSSEEDW